LYGGQELGKKLVVWLKKDLVEWGEVIYFAVF
jgi:hypothetical protein